MHFTTIIATSAAIVGALAGVGYEPEPEPVYTTTTSCTTSLAPEYEPTVAPEPEPYPTASPEPEEYPCSDVVYTSYSTYHSDYDVYTSTYYSTSACPAPEPTYVPPTKNCTTTGYDTPVPYPTEEPTPYPTEEPSHYPEEEPETYTHTYYTTVCPGKSYCYATTVTSTYCPGTTTYAPVPTYAPEPTTYAPVPEPTYEAPCPGGCYNETTTVPPPPSYTGAASSNVASFGAAAFAGLVALLVAA